MRIPSIYSVDDNGNFIPLTVKYKVWHRVHGTDDWTYDTEQVITAVSKNAIRRYWRKDGLSPGQYDIQVKLTSAECTSMTDT